MNSAKVWWYPTPRDGGTVPDHPPVFLGTADADELELTRDDEPGKEPGTS